MSDRDFNGRVALVTGGARDIGRAISLELARRGAHVVVGYHASADAAAETVARITSAGGRAQAVAADLRDPTEVGRLVTAAADFGDGRIDVLVNNSGGLVKRVGLAELTPGLIEETLRLNFVSAAMACRAVIPGMAEQGGGRIVNVGSIAAHTGGAGAHHYAAAKSALTSLGRSLTKEFGPAGVTVNTVAPGVIDNAFHVTHTPRSTFEAMVKTIPLGRAGTNEDVAGAVAFLVSDAAAYISGSVLHVNGGMYVS